MPVYRKCSECGKKVPEGTLCKCEEAKRKQSYKDYKRKRLLDEKEREVQKFYITDDWFRCRDSVAVHQFGLDLIEWSKGNDDVGAETYHHIIEVKEDWYKRFDDNNIIGLTQQNHLRVHALMNRSYKDKIKVQKWLQELIKKFNEEFY